MGYRNYFYLVPKEITKDISQLETKEQLVKYIANSNYFIERLRSDAQEAVNKNDYGECYLPVHDFGEEIQEFGKLYFDEETYDAISKDGKPLYADGHPWEIADEMARQGINLNQTDWKDSPFFKTNEVTACVEKIDIEIDKWLDELGYKREGYYYYHKVQEEKHRTIVLVSHGGSSAAAMGHILNIPFPLMCALLHIEFTGINIIRFDRKKGPGTLPCIELGNDGKHVTEGWNHRLFKK